MDVEELKQAVKGIELSEKTRERIILNCRSAVFQEEKPIMQKRMNFSVKKGEIFGFLGPSGAGKSTLEKIIIGLIPGYQGSVTVDGIESNHHGKDFYENIGVDLSSPPCMRR